MTEQFRSDLGRGKFCVDYCGYHVSWPLLSGNRIFYAHVGNPERCLSGCAYYGNVSVNGDVNADAVVSVMAHELVEAVSDPESDRNRAWEDYWGYENGNIQCLINV